MSGYWTLPSGWEWQPWREFKVQAHVAKPPAINVFFNIAGDPWSQPEERPAPGYVNVCDEQCVLIAKGANEIKVVTPATAGFASGEWTILTPNDELDRDFLAWYLRALARLAPSALGARMFTASGLNQLVVPVPSHVAGAQGLHLQRSLATQLERQMQAWREARRLADQIQRDANALVTAAISEVFAPNAATDWSPVRLGELTEFVRGKSRRSSHDPDHPRFLDIAAITRAIEAAGTVPWDTLDGWIPAPGASHELRQGDLVLDRSGRTTGRVFRLTAPPPPAICSTNSIVLRSKAIVDQAFLYWLFRSPAVQSRFSLLKTRGKTGQPSLSEEDLHEIETQIPAPDVQRQVAGYLDGIEAQAMRIAGQQRGTQILLEDLATALYRDAFVGTEA